MAMTVEDKDFIRSMLAEGFHTAFRKAVNSPRADQIWDLIKAMPSDQWGSVISFVAEPLIEGLEDRFDPGWNEQ